MKFEQRLKTKTYFIKLLDKWWSTQIKDRDNWTCVRCGHKHGEVMKKLVNKKKGIYKYSKILMTAAHIFSRTILSTKYNLDNGVAMCTRCHLFWIPSHPIEFCLMIIKLKGGEFLSKLNKLSKKKVEYSLQDYIKMCLDRNLLSDKEKQFLKEKNNG